MKYNIRHLKFVNHFTFLGYITKKMLFCLDSDYMDHKWQVRLLHCSAGVSP